MDTSDLADGGLIKRPEFPDSLLPSGCDCVIPDSQPPAEAVKRAQVVHLQPSDVLVFSNVGYEVPDDLGSQVKEALGGRRAIFFTESIVITVLREIEADAEDTEPARKTETDWLNSVEEHP